jgi:hypothetical protein
MVLNEICDDYENVDQIILANVARDCAQLGFVVERSHIVTALGELAEDGLAKAYLLSGTKPEEFRGVPSRDVVEEDFKMTSWWPFDDDGNPAP